MQTTLDLGAKTVSYSRKRASTNLLGAGKGQFAGFSWPGVRHTSLSSSSSALSTPSTSSKSLAAWSDMLVHSCSTESQIARFPESRARNRQKSPNLRFLVFFWGKKASKPQRKQGFSPQTNPQFFGMKAQNFFFSKRKKQGCPQKKGKEDLGPEK